MMGAGGQHGRGKAGDTRHQRDEERCAQNADPRAHLPPQPPQPGVSHSLLGTAKTKTAPLRSAATDRHDKPPRNAHNMPRRTPRMTQPNVAHPLQPTAHSTEARHVGSPHRNSKLTDRWEITRR